MQYINPIKQLDLLDISTGTIPRTALKSAKKKLLAEFEIQQSTTIQVANKELDKNGVLQLFEQIEQDVVFQHHVTLLEYPLFLDFLETGKIGFFERHEFIDTKNQAFVDFVAPYFAERYSPIYAKAIKEKNIEKIKLLNHVFVGKLEEYENDLYRKSYRYLYQQLQDLKVFTTTRFLKKDIAPYIDDTAIVIMNRLPNYFKTNVDQYAATLYDICLSYFNERNQQEDAIKLIKRAIRLNTSEETKERLQLLNHEMTTILKDSKSSSSSKGWLLFFLVWLIFKVIMSVFSG